MRLEVPDPHALNVARAVQEVMAPVTVVLFGSRARNRHREDSDVDLLIIADDEDRVLAEIRARKTAYAYLKANPPRLAVDVFSMTRKEFGRCRRANQHIAGQAARYGVAMNGEDLDGASGYQDSYPDHWPETRQRLENTEEYLYQFNQMVAENHWNQRMLGFSAQQAVENALKGWLSAHNDPRTFSHELTGLWNDIQGIEDWANPTTEELRKLVNSLFDRVRYEDPDSPGEDMDWLSNYAPTYRYGRTSYNMTPDERLELHEAGNKALTAIVDRVHAISGTTNSDLWTDGSRPWE